MPRSMPVVSAPRLRLWPARSRRAKPAATARAWTMSAIERDVSAALPIWGRGGGSVFGSLSRLRAVGRQLAATSRPATRREPDSPEDRTVGDAGGGEPGIQRAHRAQLGPAVGQGDDDGVRLRSLGLRDRQPQSTVGLLQPLEPDGRQLRAAQRAGEADQQQGAVALAAQIVGNGRQELLDDRDRGGDLLLRRLAFGRRVAADAGDGFGHAGIVGRHRAAGGAVQIADRGPAQIDGVGRHLPPALGRQKGSHVLAAGGKGREVTFRAPVAPGAHRRSVGLVDLPSAFH
jgi:hypothetical protein